MNKVWFLLIDGKEEGPYNIQGLKDHPFVTPDTLVRRKDSNKWQPLRFVKELQDIFKDEEQEEEVVEKPSTKISGRDVLAIEMRTDPSNLFWIIILILALAYVIFRLHTE